MTAAADWSYRPALDGLRSLAVYLVVAFHAGVVAFEGGFIGVDLFFVLSGFLVTSVLLSEHRATGAIRLGRFYARRVRRLLPAAVVAIVAIAVTAVFVEPPLTRTMQVDDGRAALLYVSNWHFVRQATDYFATDVHTSPFLHFWSLSVEEQFYVAFPLLLVGLLALGRRAAKPWLAAAGVGVLLAAGVIAQALWADRDPLRAYYGTDARVYQMLAGALLAIVITVPGARGWLAERPGRSRHGLAAGIAALAIAALVVAATDALALTPSERGFVAAAASLATIGALELAASPVTWLLSRAPIVYLGKISYGTYLWHWPIIVFARRVVDISPIALAVTAAVGATAMASLSYVLVETPVRTSTRLAPWSWQVVGAGLSASVLAAMAVVPPILRSDRPPVVSAGGRTPLALSEPTTAPMVTPTSAPRGPTSTGPPGAPTTTTPTAPLDTTATVPPELDLEAAAGYTTGQFGCRDAAPEACILVPGDGIHVLVLGDSNAAVLVPMFRELAAERGFTFSAITAAGCTWQRDLGWEVDDRTMVDECVATRDDAYDRVLPALQPDLVVTFHVSRDDPARPTVPFVPLDESLGTGAEAIATATTRSLDALDPIAARVLLVEPVPYTTFDTVQCLSAVELVVDCAYQASTEPSPTEVAYRDEAEARPRVFTLDLDRLVCPHFPICLPVLDGQLVFRDALHVYPPWLVDHRDEVWARIDATGALAGL